MDLRTYYWQGAAYQDSLLQSYRGYHLTSQSILIAIGAGLAYGVLSTESYFTMLRLYMLLSVISLLGIYLLYRMRRLIVARGQDVDFFHNRLLQVERNLPKQEQVMTEFKVYQKFHREKTDIHAFFEGYDLSEKTRSELTEKGKGHTRRFLDLQLFIAFLIVWIAFHVATLPLVIIVQ